MEIKKSLGLCSAKPRFRKLESALHCRKSKEQIIILSFFGLMQQTSSTASPCRLHPTATDGTTVHPFEPPQ